MTEPVVEPKKDADADKPVAATADKPVVSNKSSKKEKGKKMPALFIRTVPGVEGFHRAGHHFTKEGVGIALELLSDAQVKALKEEPRLIVEEVEIDLDAATGSAEA